MKVTDHLNRMRTLLVTRGSGNRMRFGLVLAFAMLAVGAMSISPANAQMIQLSTPFNTVNDSFHERMGVNFGFQLQGGRGPGSRVVGALPGNVATPNLVFSQNGISSAVPQFGGFDPNSQATFGFHNLSGGNRLSLGLQFGQGSNRSNVTTTPTVVMQNGATGSVFDAQISPFVTGFVPVVGMNRPNFNVAAPRQPRWSTALQHDPSQLKRLADRATRESTASERREPETTSRSARVSSSTVSSAAVGAPSVRAIKAQRAREEAAELAALRKEVENLVDRAKGYEAKGRIKAAKVYFRRALYKMGKRPEEFSQLRGAVRQRYEALQADLDKKDGG